MVLRLDIEPQVEALCPGDQLQLSCWHNATHNDPDWRVTNGSNEIFRAIDFQGSSLQGHTLINSTTVLEVLQIGPIQIAFNGLRYSCLYNTFSGERRSNEVMVKLHGKFGLIAIANAHVHADVMISTWHCTYMHVRTCECVHLLVMCLTESTIASDALYPLHPMYTNRASFNQRSHC